ncbi:Rap1a/Tai family immunity protein [Parvibaculum sp.]|uniref:Rap1a/Tai family immunity protein n=1 Tax=Parvibaculum sp. TaxID=2024848 RepID=UPI000EC5AAF3|nr:Rap1a/Tai family immunity protein [Parvibaculum sp.]MBO6667119.1 hypothetical protein [Parvibaculum sp.]MBO6692273.1 hypothetical protein [Parvibaculum sp.]MBO6713672.1 hypothetical protein [Parvibaculum sp.]HAC60436.1 hypothetical protein [Rhodobiaceae bacterium]
MRSPATVPRGGKFRAVALIFGLFGAVCLAPGPAEARVRIETGHDLKEACAVLAEWSLAPEPPTPRLARFCRQYLTGYFESLRVLHDDHDGKGVYAPAGDDPYACLNLDGPRTFGQLARQVVRTAEWNPDLLDGGAYDLAHKAFADRPPCS